MANIGPIPQNFHRTVRIGSQEVGTGTRQKVKDSLNLNELITIGKRIGIDFQSLDSEITSRQLLELLNVCRNTSLLKTQKKHVSFSREIPS